MKVRYVLFSPDGASTCVNDYLLNVPAATIARGELVGITKQGHSYRVKRPSGGTVVVGSADCYGELQEAKAYANKLNEQAIERKKARHANWLQAAANLEIDIEDESVPEAEIIPAP